MSLDMANLRDKILQYIPLARKKSTYPKEDVLRSRPVRNPLLEWYRDDDGYVRLRIPQRNDFVGKILCKVFHAPAYREIQLDEVGSDVWELCDGDNSVDKIVKAICSKHKISRRECEVSIGTYFKTLGDKRLLGFQLGGRKKNDESSQ